MKACAVLPQRSSKRKRIAIISLLMILLSFWVLSRYPDLLSEYQRSNTNTLTDREVGFLSKDAMLSVHGLQHPMSKIWRATINWLNTNKIGMSFGFIFSAAILLVLEQSQFLYRRAKKKGFIGVISGMLLGMPLGVCANCATPVALGLKKSGASHESAFSTLIASPSLNPIGLLMIFILFPFMAGVLRIVVISGFLLFILPLLARFTQVPEKPLIEGNIGSSGETLTDTWRASARYCAYRYWYYLKEIICKVFPAMLVVGFLGAILITYFPLEQFLLNDYDKISDIILAGLLGSLLPMPMFFDIIVLWVLYSVGLSLALTITLLITLAPTSLFAMYVMGKNVSWRLSVSITVIIASLGIATGLWVHHHEVASGKANTPGKGQHFSLMYTLQSNTRFNNKSLNSFIGSGVSLIDFNEDGHLDIFVGGKRSNTLLKNDGKGQFTDMTERSGISKETTSMAGIWGDYDNDGYPDLLVVNYKNDKGDPQANRLYHNNQNGTFTDVSLKMGLTDKSYSASAAWADFDNDGDLDLFISNYGSILVKDDKYIYGKSQHDRFYRNDGDRFVEIGKKAGVAGMAVETELLQEIETNSIKGNRGFSFQPVWFDYNNDNLIDLFVSSDFGTSQLYKNNGDGTFSNETKNVGLDVFGTGMGVEIVDINDDGFFDILLTTGTDNQMWVNDRQGNFIEEGITRGLSDNQRFGWGVAAIDFENNGVPALFVINGVSMNYGNLSNKFNAISKISNSNILFMKEENGHYKNYNKKFRLFNDMIGRGLAIGDLNNDGYMDVAVSNRENDAQLIVYRNSGNDNKSLTVKLEGARDVNRMAVGTRVSVYVNGSVQHKMITAGSSFLSQNSPLLHFGIGERDEVDKVVVRWPNGRKQIIRHVSVKDVLKVKYTSQR